MNAKTTGAVAAGLALLGGTVLRRYLSSWLEPFSLDAIHPAGAAYYWYRSSKADAKADKKEDWCASLLPRSLEVRPAEPMVWVHALVVG